jgi:hypothetical protein
MPQGLSLGHCHKYSMRVTDLEDWVFDQIENVNGVPGVAPLNMDVNTQGLKVLMKPTMFMMLSSNFEPWSEDDDKMLAYLKNNGPIGAPFLMLEVSMDWLDSDFSQMARVRGHDGRHRMRCILRGWGDCWVETHLFLRPENQSIWSPSIRNRHITKDWQAALNRGLKAQTSNAPVSGPIFKVA